MKDFIVEINPSNDLIVNLNETGLMQSGIPFNNKDMIQRNYKILKRLFEAESRAPLPEEVKTERLSQE